MSSKELLIKKYALIIVTALMLSSCGLFKSDEDKAIEIVQQTKTNDKDSETWMVRANEQASGDANMKYFWEAEKTSEDGVFLVSFVDSSKWGMRWEVTLKEKIVRYVNGNDYLSLKYGLSRLDPTESFIISNVKIDTIRIENEGIQQDLWDALFEEKKYKKIVVYRFQAEVTNNTDKFISSASLKGKLKLIFKEKTIEGSSGTMNFNNSISNSKPWEPGETKIINIRTKEIEKVYLNYEPEYAIFEINLKADDPIGYSFDKNIWEVDLTEEWIEFTTQLKSKK